MRSAVEEVVEKREVQNVEATRRDDEDARKAAEDARIAADNARTAAMMQAYGDGLSTGYVGKIFITGDVASISDCQSQDQCL